MKTRDSRVYSTRADQPYRVLAHQPDWMKSPIKSVAFNHTDRDLGMTVEVHVHWTQAFEYMLRKGPGYHTVAAIICENGERIHTNSLSSSWDHPGGYVVDRAYHAAPTMARDKFAITEMMHRTRLLEVAGAYEWCYSKRDAAANERFYAAGAEQPLSSTAS